MEDRYTLVEDSNNTYLVTRVSGPEGGHPSGWDGWRLGPGTGGGRAAGTAPGHTTCTGDQLL